MIKFSVTYTHSKYSGTAATQTIFAKDEEHAIQKAKEQNGVDIIILEVKKQK